jgi:COMPASS component SWD3
MDIELDRKQDVLPRDVALPGVKGMPTVPEHLPGSQEQLTAHRSGPSYRARYILSGHSLSISSVKFSPDGSLLASSGMLASPVAFRPSCSFCLEGSCR